MCVACSRTKEGTTPWHAQKKPIRRTRIHDRARDSLPRQIRKKGTTATVQGRDELQWLDVTTGRPTAVSNAEGAARLGGFAATH